MLQSLVRRNTLLTRNRVQQICLRSFVTDMEKREIEMEQAKSHKHFRESDRDHPLIPNKKGNSEEKSLGDHSGRQQNYIWDKESLEKALSTHDYKHIPVTTSDHIANKIMYGLYVTANKVTGYKPADPTPRSIEWRLIVLESFAGVPGFVAAGYRHFNSIRRLKKDHGWIYTLLEEAENERMHLQVCLRMFNATPVTRFFVVAAQFTMTPLLMLLYAVKPKAMHRFVGYLEQTACDTYYNIITKTETPGTKLHTAWSELPAPPMAIGYWKLDDDAKWIDALKCMYADETHHRDCNHTFATMETDDPNPFVKEHKEAAATAWLLEQRKSQAKKV